MSTIIPGMDAVGNPDRLLILIPAYNEEGAIRDVICQARSMAPGADVLVVDDGSVDLTAAAAAGTGAFVVRHPFNLGIGGTVQTGLKFARQHGYQYVIRLDGDGQHNPAGIPTLLQTLLSGKADVVIGSRFLSNGPTMPIPFSRRLGILLFARTVSLITGRKATDTTSGFQALNRRAIDLLADYMPQDYPEVEGRVILHKAGLTTLEIPAEMRVRLTGVSSINRWRSVYYACKVSIAAMICALKEIPAVVEELPNDPARTKSHRRHLQPHFGVGDGSTDS